MAKKKNKTPSKPPQSSRAPAKPQAKPALKPNVALRQVREVMGLTQAEFAERLGLSTALIQGVELGQREASNYLASRVRDITGAAPTSILKCLENAKDIENKPYDRDSFESLVKGPERKLTADAERELLLPVLRLARAAAKAGKIKIFGTVLAEELMATKQRLALGVALDWVLKNETRSVREHEYGFLRKNPLIAEAVGFVDDPGVPDHKPWMVSGSPADPKPAPELIPPSEFFPRPDNPPEITEDALKVGEEVC